MAAKRTAKVSSFSSFIIFTLFTEQIQLNNIIYNDTGMKIQIKG